MDFGPPNMVWRFPTLGGMHDLPPNIEAVSHKRQPNLVYARNQNELGMIG